MTDKTTDTIGDSKKQEPKKSFIAKVSEALMILTVLGGLTFLTQEDGLHKFLTYLIVPGVFFVIAIIYNLHIIGTHIASAIFFLDSIGINGLPALAIILLVVLAITNIFSTEKLWSEMMKVVGGVASGSLAQAKLSTRSRTRNNPEKPTSSETPSTRKRRPPRNSNTN